jgi:hypothetical protein
MKVSCVDTTTSFTLGMYAAPKRRWIVTGGGLYHLNGMGAFTESGSAMCVRREIGQSTT